jgi:ABC-type nickel/cobalt efflux system permease component RcnA
VERIFGGALALMSVLIAVFTFAFLRFVEEAGRPETQRAYFWLLLISTALVVGTGASAIVAHLRLGSGHYPFLHYFFAAILGLATMSPVIFWLLF